MFDTLFFIVWLSVVIGCIAMQVYGNPWPELSLKYGSDRQPTVASVTRCWLEAQLSRPPTPWRISMWASRHYPSAVLSIHQSGLEIGFSPIAVGWFGVSFRPIRFETLFIPWNEVEIAARRGQYEYKGSVIMRFAKTPLIGLRISGGVMDELMKLGAPFQIADDEQLRRIDGTF